MKGLSLVTKVVITFAIVFTIVSIHKSIDDKWISGNNIAKAEYGAVNQDAEKLQKEINPSEASKKEGKKGKSSKKDKSDKKVKKSYASLIFDKTDKNQSIMYFNSQTNAGVKTVESIVNDKSKDGQGTEYAAFLKSMDNWNLYQVYTNQKDVGKGLLLGGIVKIYGGILLGCLYVMDGLDYLLKMFADLFDYLNIYKYITNENGVIPKTNPLSILQPILDVIKGLGTMAKVIISIFLAWVLFMVTTGIGPAKNRSSYFGKGVGKVMLATISLVLVPFILSAFFGMFSDILKDQNNVAKNTVNSIPGKFIVDTNKWIDNSLTAAKGTKNNEAVNGGFVLLHDHKNMPKNESDIKNKIPTPGLVSYLNTADKSKTPDGKVLLGKWTNSDTITANDIDSMYGISDDDREGWGGVLGNDEKRAFQFKLAPEANSVKAFGGKKAISLDLNDVAIDTATLAGNGGYGQFLNAISMGVMIVGTTIVIGTLFIAMFVSFIRSIQEAATHWIASTFLSISGFVGTFIVMAMLLVSFGSVMLLAPLFGELVNGINKISAEWINDNLDLTGTAKQTITTIATVIVMLFAMVFTLKGRKAIMGIAQDHFNNILSKLNMNGVSPSGRHNIAHSSLNNMADDVGVNGLENGLSNMMYSPIDKANSSLTSLSDMAKDKLGDFNDSIKEKSGDAYENLKEKTSDFAGKLKGEESVDDADKQGEAISDEVENGIKNMSDQSSGGIESSFDNQEKVIDKAMQSNDELMKAERDLESAKENLEALKRSGASSEAIKAAQDDVDNAQSKYDNSLGRNQDVVKEMAESGASVQDIVSAQNENAKEYNSATNDINDAQKELDNLKSQKEQLETLGASGSELQGIEKEIGQAEDKLENAKSRQSLAKEAYNAKVGNAQVEKDARNDLLSAQQAQRAATRNLRSANEHGNLSSSQYGKLQSASKHLSDDMNYDLNKTQGQIRDLESQRGALEFMSNNGGKAFAESDIKSQGEMLEKATSNVGNLERKYAQAQKSKASKNQLSQINNELSQAKAQQATLQTVMGTIQSGKFNESALKAQESIVDQAYSNREKAQQEMVKIQKRENSGELIERSVMQEARANVKATNSAYQQATRTLKGLEAQKVAGGNTLASDKIQSRQQVAEQKIQGLQARYNTLKSGSNASEILSNGGLIDKHQTHDLSKAHKIIQENATNDKNNAITNYEKMAQKVEKLKQQEAKGMPVSAEVNRLQKGLKQAEKQMNNAIKHDKFVRSQGNEINRTGQTMLNNIKSAKKEVTEANVKLKDKQTKHDNVLKGGGYTHEQLSKYKTNVEQDKELYNTNKGQLKRQRREQVEAVKNNLDRSNKIMGNKKK
ncbi:hypothetical protein BU002_02060 [Mammaliicoccus sciuri]|uniref:hypothetical protein n=1 Tax=Mammaliicoccus sciuri TaxID=1296 RepID=UPI000E6984B9|nr:hypothetical protein [Mammaliicoccus sciuri]RIN97124.1 hypothetical protein BU002_02060 [Mammaliicoccus sciuri]